MVGPQNTAVLGVNTMKIESTTKSDQTSMSPKNVTTFQIYLRTLTIAFCLSYVVNFNVILLKFVQLIDQDPKNLEPYYSSANQLWTIFKHFPREHTYT